MGHSHCQFQSVTDTGILGSCCILALSLYILPLVFGQVNFWVTFVGLFSRLSNIEELTRATMKKLTQGMAEHNKAMSAAKSDEAKEKVVSLLL